MILYIGNKLSKYGKNPTSVETLGPLLKKYYSLVLISDKRSKWMRFLHIVYSLFRLRSELSLILVDTYSSLAFYYSVIVSQFCKYSGIPYILILRGGNLKTRINHRSVFDGAFKLVAPSPFMSELFNDNGFPNVCMIHNNIVLSGYKFKERSRIKCKLLWVRAFQQLYQPEMAIQVLHELLPQYPDAQLCMVGPDKDGSLERCRQLCQKLGITHNVIFKGQMSKQDWHALASDYDIFLNTTAIDNTPISVMEAMALGLPIVSTNVGGITKLLTNEFDALLVSSNNRQDMINMIKRLVDSPDLVKRVSSNALTTVKKFDWEKIKEKWIEMIDQVVGAEQERGGS